MHKAIRLFATVTVLPLLAALSATAFAQGYPSKPITLIVTWPAGGTTDVIARLMADPLGKDLGQPMAVVNRKGGGGSLGTQAALDAPHDGHTLLMTTSGNHILTPLKKDVGYRYDDFVPIGQVASRTMVIAVRADSPWKSLGDMVKAAKANPGKYNFGAVPNGMPHLTLNTLATEQGLDIVHVPQQGGAPGAIALLGGTVDMLPASTGTVASNLKAGKMRALCVFNKKRDPAWPDVPTAAEQGFEVFGNPFTGVAVAKGTPADVVAKLQAAVRKVATDPAFQKRAVAAGSGVDYLSAQEFGAVWARDWKNYEPVLRK